MSKGQFATVVVLLSVIAALVAAPAVVGHRATQWEYSVKGLYDSTFQAELTRLGNEGWGIVSARRAVSDGVGMYEIIFKRPK